MIQIVEREMTSEEHARGEVVFDENSREHGVEIQTSERFTTVAVDGDRFIGAASGLAYRNGEAYSWFYLTDLFVERDQRKRGTGRELLAVLERRLRELGIRQIWTWTAGYEAPGFYLRCGYRIFTELENYYSNGASRVGVRKDL